MQIIRVSNSSEKLMLNTVSRLRRLFRNALRTTKLPSVIRFLTFFPTQSPLKFANVAPPSRRLSWWRLAATVANLAGKMPALPDMPQPVHYVDLRSMVGRQGRAQQSHHPGRQQGGQPDPVGHPQREKADELWGVGQEINQPPSQPRADQSAQQRQRDCLAHEQSQHAVPGET